MNTDSVNSGGGKLQRRPSLKFRMSFKSKKTRQAMVERSCRELALEGERLCKEGRWVEGTERLEAATKTGTQDLRTLSALYSQLGNAYFYMEKYSKSLEYHKQDLTLARSMGDKLGEAKACGNIGSALKSLGQFDESIACCRMQLDLSRELQDQVLESRALYNLGNVYHARGKHASANGLVTTDPSQQEMGQYVRTSLEQATRHYESNLKIVLELGDYQAQGRTVGNLGNTYYLLGNYKKAIKYHEERLAIAELLNDKIAIRRAYSNLGNAQVFLGKYSPAAQYYLNALEVSREMGDSAFEAQSCYSLGNTFTLMEDYHKAIEYHLTHLQFALQLDDRIGEARAYWSLGNAYSAIKDLRQARHFARKHLQVSVQLGDQEGIMTAKRNLADLETALELSTKYECPSPSPRLSTTSNSSFSWSNMPGITRKKKLHKKPSTYSLKSDCSTGSLSIYTKTHSPLDSRAGSTGTVSPTSSLASSHEDSPPISGSNGPNPSHRRADEFTVDDRFLDLISKTQGRRLDDQRSTLPLSPDDIQPSTRQSQGSLSEEDDLFDALWRFQSSRIEDQRCDMPNGVPPPHVMPQTNWEETEAECLSSDELFEMIFRCQSSRINDQRSPDPRNKGPRKSTMPSEDFFNLIQHLQSTRIEDQRSPLPVLAN